MPATPLIAKVLAWLLVPVLALTWFVYSPGLSGGFLFDDYPNLAGLARLGSNAGWPELLRYLTSGTADPLGRPIALASFLLNAADWPDSPRSFLQVNLALHLTNGSLLFVLLLKLGHLLGDDKVLRTKSALLGAALWLLHPLFVSTTLYAVQREAMLPATFILCGLFFYLKGRIQLQQTDGRSGLGLMAGAIAGFTVLAGLSKANGLLLPLLAWVIEMTLLVGPAHLPETVADRSRLARTKLLLLKVPSILLMLYIGSYAVSWNFTSQYRDWTIGQRLMTEPRIMLDYLRLLAIPRAVSTGLFNDSYQVSTGLFDPAATALAIAAVTTLLAIAFRVRRTAPAISAALLFFFAGHLLESGPVPLELYYEHRNYVPALLLFWPIARLLFSPPIKPLVGSLAAVLLVILMATTTYRRAELWGQPEQLAATWAHINPNSSRAQATAALAEADHGNHAEAINRLDLAWKRKPDDLQLAFAYVAVACSSGVSREDAHRMAGTLRRARAGHRFINPWMRNLIAQSTAGQCRGVDLEQFSEWTNAVLDNPKMLKNASLRGEELEPILGLIAAHRGEPQLALAHYNTALQSRPGPNVAASQASSLAAMGYLAEALSHLDFYSTLSVVPTAPPRGMARVHALVLESEGYWPRELGMLRNSIQSEIDRESKRPARNPTQ